MLKKQLNVGSRIVLRSYLVYNALICSGGQEEPVPPGPVRLPERDPGHLRVGLLRPRVQAAVGVRTASVRAHAAGPGH